MLGQTYTADCVGAASVQSYHLRAANKGREKRTKILDVYGSLIDLARVFEAVCLFVCYSDDWLIVNRQRGLADC